MCLEDPQVQIWIQLSRHGVKDFVRLQIERIIYANVLTSADSASQLTLFHEVVQDAKLTKSMTTSKGNRLDKDCKADGALDLLFQKLSLLVSDEARVGAKAVAICHVSLIDCAVDGSINGGTA